MIIFSCTHCRRNLRVGDEWAGKEARCPLCGQVGPIPKGLVLAAVPVSANLGPAFPRGEAEVQAVTPSPQDSSPGSETSDPEGMDGTQDIPPRPPADKAADELY